MSQWHSWRGIAGQEQYTCVQDASSARRQKCAKQVPCIGETSYPYSNWPDECKLKGTRCNRTLSDDQSPQSSNRFLEPVARLREDHEINFLLVSALYQLFHFVRTPAADPRTPGISSLGASRTLGGEHWDFLFIRVCVRVRTGRKSLNHLGEPTAWEEASRTPGDDHGDLFLLFIRVRTGRKQWLGFLKLQG